MVILCELLQKMDGEAMFPNPMYEDSNNDTKCRKRYSKKGKRPTQMQKRSAFQQINFKLHKTGYYPRTKRHTLHKGRDGSIFENKSV